VWADELACKPDIDVPRPMIVHAVTSAARAPAASLTRWLRHPCPRHHREQSGQDEGTREDQCHEHDRLNTTVFGHPTIYTAHYDRT
jgi:hypothetical protein